MNGTCTLGVLGDFDVPSQFKYDKFQGVACCSLITWAENLL